MVSFFTWFPPLLTGALFSALGVAKVYGRCKGIEGGGGKPWTQRACGSCPSWNRQINLGMTILWLVMGLAHLAWVGWLLFGRNP
jgi:hypothetical protein